MLLTCNTIRNSKATWNARKKVKKANAYCEVGTVF